MSAFANAAAATPHLGLPLLYAGQAQKEFFVNQSLCVLDALAAQSVVGAAAEPPPNPADGDCYRVAAGATGAWTDKEGQLAIAVAGDWHFISPREGQWIFDSTLGQAFRFTGGWQDARVPAAANGGSVVDAQARDLLAQVIDALAKLGLVALDPG